MKPSFTRIACFFSVFLFSHVLMAQEIIISSGGSYTGCGAIILDTGGNTGDYSPGEYIEFTICPEAPDSIITLDFLIFSLAENDFMNIYQGLDTSAPLEGSYMGFDLNGQVVTTSEDNESGCLTIQFASDLEETGNFGFAVSCGPPCDRPEAIIDAGGPNPILVCVDEEVTFDGNPSVYADGASLGSYNWTFGDGTSDNTSGMVVTHSYSQPGEYRVQLFLVDDNGCNSINLPDVQILVGTTPSFEDSDENIEICLGQEVDLSGSVTGTLWNGQPENPIGGYLEIPDDQTQCFSSEITFSNFLPGQTVDSTSDIESIFVNMEHSFMGDLVISLICPNGQTLTMHQQGGGGTNLGVPVTGDNAAIIPGVGWDYWWAPDATNGTWAGEAGGQIALPSGTYSSVQPFDLLVGCPLNGIWTLEICDLWAADNGVVFDWTVAFDPSLYPDITQFTPTYGAGCDSTAWSGQFITSTGPDCNSISVYPDETGIFQYTYTATDNHGCTYEHIANLTVVQGPLADVLNEELAFCGDPIQLNAIVSNSTPGSNYIYEWSPATGLSNPNVANPMLQNLTEDQTFTVFIYQAGQEVCGSEATVFVEYIPPVFSDVEVSLCQGDQYVLPGGSTVTAPGLYTDTIPSLVTGCDSVVATTLAYFEVYEVSNDVSLCGSESVELPDGNTVNQPGVYEVVLMTSDGCDSLIVTNVTVITVDAGEYDPVCPNNYPYNFALSGQVQPEDPTATVTWTGDLTFSNASSLVTPVTANESGAYNVELTDSRCPDDPSSTLLVLRTPPQVSFNEIPDICLGESQMVQPNITGDYAQPPYQWNDDLGFYFDEDAGSINIEGVEYEGFLSTPNVVTLTVPGISPCPSASGSFVVEVIDCDITIPNIFTPDGNAYNNTFEIPGLENFPGSTMVIYNRWGKLVYQSDSYRAPYWNGRHYQSGVECADGVYYYELVIGRLNKIEKGTITLLRN